MKKEIVDKKYTPGSPVGLVHFNDNGFIAGYYQSKHGTLRITGSGDPKCGKYHYRFTFVYNGTLYTRSIYLNGQGYSSRGLIILAGKFQKEIVAKTDIILRRKLKIKKSQEAIKKIANLKTPIEECQIEKINETDVFLLKNRQEEKLDFINMKIISYTIQIEELQKEQKEADKRLKKIKKSTKLIRKATKLIDF